MRVLDLFSGVGMFAYGMEQAGFETAAFCEIEEWPRKVLAKHWPDVPIYEDVRELNSERLEEDGIGSIDIITGGFPCQDISVAGKQSGIDGKRSGLWSECARLTRELRPKYVIWENVSALLSGGDLVDTASGPVYRTWFGRILRDMAEIGYDCEWHSLCAGKPDGLSAGAPHRRERVWIVAYPQYDGRDEGQDTRRTGGAGETQQGVMGQVTEHGKSEGQGDVAHPGHHEPQGRNKPETDYQGCSGERIQEGSESSSPCGDVAHSSIKGLEGTERKKHEGRGERPTECSENVAHASSSRQPGQGEPVNPGNQEAAGEGQTTDALDECEREIGPVISSLGLLAHGIASRLARSRWLPEPGIGRVATGVPDRVQKLKALGNGLVWQIPYAIGCSINELENENE